MLNSFLEKTKKGLNDLATNAKKYRNADFLESAMAASAMITVADGSITREEKEKAFNFVKNLEALQIFDPIEVGNCFKKHLDRLDPDNPGTDVDIASITSMQIIGKIKKNDAQARMVLRLAIAIGGADGNFDDQEKTKASQIAKELGLSPSEFDLPS